MDATIQNLAKIVTEIKKAKAVVRTNPFKAMRMLEGVQKDMENIIKPEEDYPKSEEEYILGG